MATEDPEIGNGGADPDATKFDPATGDPVKKHEATPEELEEWRYQVGAGPKPGSPDPIPQGTAIPAAPPMASPSPADAATLALVGGHLKVNASLATQEGIAWLIGLLRQTSVELFEEVDKVEVAMRDLEAFNKGQRLSSSELLGGTRPRAPLENTAERENPAAAVKPEDLGDPGVGRGKD